MPRGRKPGVPLPDALRADLRAFCDAHTRRVAPELIGVSPRTLYKALAGMGVDATTHERVALALGRDAGEYEAMRAEAEAAFDNAVEQLRAAGHALDSARRIARAVFLSALL